MLFRSCLRNTHQTRLEKNLQNNIFRNSLNNVTKLLPYVNVATIQKDFNRVVNIKSLQHNLASNLSYLTVVFIIVFNMGLEVSNFSFFSLYFAGDTPRCKVLPFVKEKKKTD